MAVTQSELRRILRAQDRFMERVKQIEKQFEEGLTEEGQSSKTATRSDKRSE